MLPSASAKEISKVRKLVASMEIHDLNKRNLSKGGTFSAVTEVLEKRKKAEELFQKREAIKLFYQEYDSRLYPSFLFFHTDVVNVCGKCLFSHIRDESVDVLNLETSRQTWLESTPDYGSCYYDLFARLCLKSRATQFSKRLDELHNEVSSWLQSHLTLELYNQFKEAEHLLEDYKRHSVKSKKRKDQLNQVINILSLIYQETHLAVHSYLSKKHAVPLVVNGIKATTDSPREIHVLYVSEQLDKYVDEMENVQNLLTTEVKYIKNVSEHLMECLIDSHIRYIESSHAQIGKYFKKWSMMNQNEKEDRIQSFCEWYVDSYLLKTNIIDNSIRESLHKQMSEEVSNALSSNFLTFRDIKWCAKKGIISKIEHILYLEQERKFFVEKDSSAKQTIRKASVSKTIFLRSNENLINDTILQCVLKKMGEGETLVALKEKLKLHKMSSADKKTFRTRFMEIQSIVNS